MATKKPVKKTKAVSKSKKPAPPKKKTKKPASKKRGPKVFAFMPEKVQILDIPGDPGKEGKVAHNTAFDIAGWISSWSSGVAIKAKISESDQNGVPSDPMTFSEILNIPTTQLGGTTYGSWTATIPAGAIPTQGAFYLIEVIDTNSAYTGSSAVVQTW